MNGLSPSRQGTPGAGGAAAALVSLAPAFLVGLLGRPVPPDLSPLAWLLPAAAWDLHRREVPHIAFTAVPAALAALAAAWQGSWTLAVLAALAALAGERRRLPGPAARLAFVPVLAAFAVLIVLTPLEQSPGAAAITGFWLAHELGWWAGADALAAIALALQWPEVRLLICMAAAHLGLTVFILPARHLPSPRVLGDEELEALGVPGLPAIALAAALCALWRWWLP